MNALTPSFMRCAHIVYDVYRQAQRVQGKPLTATGARPRRGATKILSSRKSHPNIDIYRNFSYAFNSGLLGSWPRGNRRRCIRSRRDLGPRKGGWRNRRNEKAVK